MFMYVPPFRRLFLTAAFLAAATLPATLASSPAFADPVEPIDIALVGFNDFHESVADPQTVQFAGTIEAIREEYGEESTLLLSAGDILREGGTQNPNSTSYVPTLCALNALDVSATAVGNHEFHYGALTTNGYATPLKTTVASIADFSFLSANILKSSVPQFPAYEVFDVAGVKVAVIGATTRDTPYLDPRHLLWGLTFPDPVAAVNTAAASLKASPNPPDIIVAVYHEGATLDDPSSGLTQDKTRVVYSTSADVDVIFSGHVHAHADIDGPVPGQPGVYRPVIQSDSHGAQVSKVVLSIDPATKNILSYDAQNVDRTTETKANLISEYPRADQVDEIVTAGPMSACPQ